MTTLAPQRLHRVLSYIEEHVNERVAVQQLAATVHMSPFHFTRVFKVAIGHSPHAYLTRVRMERARELLATTQLPILEVARRVGFQTQAHFTCVFRKHTGTTPRAFRVTQSLSRMASVGPGDGELPEAVGGRLPLELPAAANEAQVYPGSG